MAAINRSTDMTTGSIWKRMVSFAVPVFLGNLCQQLYNTVDSVIVGKFVGEEALAAEVGVGLPTLRDIVAELQRPGRDPRDELPPPLLRTDVMGIEDLKPGMEMTGTVRNVIDFGAFIDIGVHQDGLAHISRLTRRFIRHPSEVLKVGDVVKAWVLSVDVEKKRIGLTLLPPESTL